MICDQKQGKNYSALNIGALGCLQNYIYNPARIPGEFPGKLFLRDQLNLTGMEISFNSMAPGGAMPFIHKHNTHEELFVCLSGSGEIQLDGERFPIGEGSCIRIAPEAERSWRNCGEEELIFLVVQAKVNTISVSEGEDGDLVQKPVNW